MQYTNEIIIDLPRERVIELFDSSENLKHWQPTLIDTEHIEGEPGRAGSKMQMRYKQGSRTMEMVETIQANNLPESFDAVYEASGVWNLNKNQFHDQGDQTRWVMDTEFRFSGFMKIVSFFIRGAFPKQSRQSMQDFKTWAESVA